MKDISSRDDIELLIRRFYDKVQKDDLLSSFFKDVNWTTHLPVMYDFWETVLFFTGNYSGNPMQAHKALNQRMPMKPEHFTRWLTLFTETIQEMFEGEKAGLAHTRAKAIAYLMQQKISA
jgi:hemoglobin